MTHPYQPPQPPAENIAPKRKRGVPVWLFIVALIVTMFASCGIGVGIGGSGETVAADEPTAEPMRPIQGRDATSRVETPEPKKPEPKPEPKTVLKTSGNGIKTTKTFSVQGDWDLRYTYDCANFGVEGNFQVWADGALGAIYVNELGMSGDDVTHQHDGAGDMALKVNSTCDWTIRVVDLP